MPNWTLRQYYDFCGGALGRVEFIGAGGAHASTDWLLDAYLNNH
jgi:hypothetical protein